MGQVGPQARLDQVGLHLWYGEHDHHDPRGDGRHTWLGLGLGLGDGRHTWVMGQHGGDRQTNSLGQPDHQPQRPGGGPEHAAGGAVGGGRIGGGERAAISIELRSRHLWPANFGPAAMPPACQRVKASPLSVAMIPGGVINR